VTDPEHPSFFISEISEHSRSLTNQ
jgi:hypothetical protein